jgi:hypothetical protein
VEYGGVPPVAVRVREYAEFTVPEVKGDVVVIAKVVAALVIDTVLVSLPGASSSGSNGRSPATPGPASRNIAAVK